VSFVPRIINDYLLRSNATFAGIVTACGTAWSIVYCSALWFYPSGTIIIVVVITIITNTAAAFTITITVPLLSLAPNISKGCGQGTFGSTLMKFLEHDTTLWSHAVCVAIVNALTSFYIFTFR
jgi:hypothetical protein